MVDINVSYQKDKVTLVEASGRVDSFNATDVGDALSGEISGGNVRLVLDLSHVDYMSSAGLREMVNSLKSARKASGDLRLAQPSDRVREVLEMAGLDSIFRIYPTQSDAIDSY